MNTATKSGSAEWWRQRRRTNVNALLNVRYLDIKRRSEGNATTKSSAEGKPYVTRKEFFEWCEETKSIFQELHKVWVENGNPQSLSPSVDRIDNNIGYVRGNMQWLTTGANSKKRNK